jgi:hypothetical protein
MHSPRRNRARRTVLLGAARRGMKHDTTAGFGDFVDFYAVKMRQQLADDLITPSTQRLTRTWCETASVNKSISVLTLVPRTHDLLTPRRTTRWPEGRPHPELQVLDLLVDGTITAIGGLVAMAPTPALAMPAQRS